ncbi:MAG TPA: DUF488 domain-containing protein [Geomonas sp.]|nr:DUF488 domain-containing protein [Geomonas sp.]
MTTQTGRKKETTGEAPPRESPDLTIYTMGHSTHDLDSFIELLRLYRIEEVVDVRTIPRSRHNPQFNKESLSPFLRVRRIKYLHLKELGGLRRHVKDDPRNAGWLNASFRGFADYMQTGDFREGLEILLRVARQRTTVIMCAEAVPWRCHRSLIGDALSVRGIEVIDIISASSARRHVITPMAKVDGTEITYPEPSAAPQAKTA